MGLQIENLCKILKIAGNDDAITMSTEEEEPSQLKFEFESKSILHLIIFRGGQSFDFQFEFNYLRQ